MISPSLLSYLNELDTLKDFVTYLEEKEIFIRKSNSIISYTDEEDLLYHYVLNFDDKTKRHTFLSRSEYKKDYDTISFMEEDWGDLRRDLNI